MPITRVYKNKMPPVIPWYRFVLPKLLAEITGRPRYLPQNLEFNTKVYTSNIFRAFEWLFFRAYGKNGVGDTIRKEVSATGEMIDGVMHIERTFYTLEALIGHTEMAVRAYAGKLVEPRPEFGYMPQPVFLTLGFLGLSLSLHGDMHGILLAPFIGMAIATDTSGTTHPSGSATATIGITVTATADQIVWGASTANKATVPAISTVTWAGAGMTASANSPKSLPSDTSLKIFLYYKLSPTSGANNLVFTYASAPDEISAHAVSYSGVGSVPQDVSTNGTGGTTTLSFTTTVDNSWLVGIARNNSDGNGTASTATTRRSNIAGQNAFYDSNGAKTPTGSYSLVITHGSAEYGAIGMSMAPVVAVNVTVNASLLSFAAALYTATITAIRTISVSGTLQSASFTLPSATVTAIQNASSTPTLQTATFSTQAPTITAIQSPTVNPNLVTATFSTLAPNIITPDADVRPAVQIATFTIPAYTPIGQQNVTASPACPTALFALQSPSVSIGATISPSVLSASFTANEPVITTIQNISVAPSAVTATFTLPSATVSAEKNALVSPSPVTATFTIPGSSVVVVRNVSIDAPVSIAHFSLLGVQHAGEIWSVVPKDEDEWVVSARHE